MLYIAKIKIKATQNMSMLFDVVNANKLLVHKQQLI